MTPAHPWPCFTTALLVALAATVIGCAQQPSQFPILEVETAHDASLACDGLEDQLLRANALRDAIMREHGDVLAANVFSDATNVAFDPVFGTVEAVVSAPFRQKRYDHYREAAAAAESRIVHVLELRVTRPCRSGPTTDPALDERQIHEALRDLDARAAAKTLSTREYRQQRRALLDSVR